MYRCPVCGYPELDEAHRSPGGNDSYAICPACGFQYGIADGDLGISYEQWRSQWVDGGMKWWSSRDMPVWWDPAKHLNDLLGSPEADAKANLADEPDTHPDQDLDRN